MINILKHEIRKKEIELQKLKENLQKKFNGSMVNSGVRFHLSNPLSKIDMSTNRKSSVIIIIYIYIYINDYHSY